MGASPPDTARSLRHWVALALLSTLACSGPVEGTEPGSPASEADERPEWYLSLDAQQQSRLGSLLEGPACATGMSSIEPVPAVVQLVVDTSGSMQWPAGWEPRANETPPAGILSKWAITQRALRDAVAEMAPATSVGVNFYPNVGHSGSSCIQNAIAVPMRSLGLPGSSQRQELERALDGVKPRGGTPTHGAYHYGVNTLARLATANAGFVVLITDGAPTYTQTCAGDGTTPVDSAPLIAEAASVLRSRAIRTFVIGTPGSEQGRGALSRVAHAGGTAAASCTHDGPNYCHFDMTRDSDLGAALQRAFADISARMTTCEYPIPPAPSGRTLDPARVNVVHSAAQSEPAYILRNHSACDGEGWVYSEDGRRIVLCETTCARVQSDPSSRVEVLFGCASEFRPPG